MRLIDSCITQLKAQGHSWTCNESDEEEEEVMPRFFQELGKTPAPSDPKVPQSYIKRELNANLLAMKFTMQHVIHKEYSSICVVIFNARKF